jgi:hypothetical protein
MEKVSKELHILKSLTTNDYFNKIEELMKAKNKYIILKEDSLCTKCAKRISNYPFYYLPKSKDMIHYYCFTEDLKQQHGVGNQSGISGSKVEHVTEIKV